MTSMLSRSISRPIQAITITESTIQFANMECKNNRGNEKRTRRRKTSFTEALKEKYCVQDDPAFDFIIVSPKRKTNSSAELAHLQTVVLNDMDITRADIPRQGLVSLCPNVVDLDLANNLLETWSELLSILSHLPKVRYLNVSRNRLSLDITDTSDQPQKLTVENLALNDTGTTIEEVVRLSQLMPTLKELHLCDNNYEDLARIEDSINDGAFSCLECLRLNNNEISRWSEVWKLRHLPHLKCLVLSGNPISNVFYHSVDRTDNNNTNLTDIYKKTGHRCTAKISQKSSVSGNSNVDNSGTAERCLQCELADSNMDMNGECDVLLIDNFNQDDDTATEETCDSTQSVDRFGFQAESDSSAGNSSDQDIVPGNECDNFISSNSNDKFRIRNIKTSGTSSSNINNSCQGNVQRCLCEGYQGFDVGYMLTDDVFDNGNVVDVNNIENDDWHRAVAEEFLHEIIDGINFDDISDQTVPQFLPSNCDLPDITSYSPQDVEELSNSDSIAEGNVECSAESLAIEQLSGECSALDDSVSTVGDSCLGLDYSLMSSAIDAQFIPRAVSLLDDDIKSSFFYMATPSPPRSRVQRCLFQEAGFSGHHGKQIEDTSYRDNHSQSVSDSCSDCEAEQYKNRKQTADVGAQTGSMVASENITFKTPRTSPSHSKLESNINAPCHNTHAQNSSTSFCVANTSLSPQIKERVHFTEPITNCRSHKDEQNVPTCRLHINEQNLGSNNNNSVLEHSGYNHHNDNSCHHHTESDVKPEPFHQLQVLCLSSANLHHWNHLTAFTAFPKLTNLRLKNNPLYSNVNPDDRRKLYIASLPKVNTLNGSEVTHTEREKAERHYLRYFMDKEDRPDFYHTLVKKHGPPVKLVDIDLSAGYQEWANLKFVCKGVEEFSRKIHLVEPVGRLRIMIAHIMRLPKRCFIMYHHSCGPSHPESERELVELRCEALPMSRFDFADGDEIHIDVQE